LFLEEPDHGLMECRLVGRGKVVAFAGSGACGWDRAEEAIDLLIGGVGAAVKDQDRNFDGAERLHRPRWHHGSANDGGEYFGIGLCCARSYEARGGEVPGNDFSLFENAGTLLRPHAARNRGTESGIGQFLVNSITLSSST